MRLDNLLDQRWSRNPALVQGLVALDIIEELGFGLDRMVAAMAAAGLPAPVFREVGNTFVVTLYGPGAALLRTQPRTPEAQPVRRLSRHEREEWILNYVRTVGPLSPRAYVEAVGIDRKTALTDLHGLAERGLIQAQGTTTDRRYTLPREDR
jgi:predicted HTH transcriptional regulator